MSDTPEQRGQPNQDAAPAGAVRRKRPRVVSQPQRLEVKTELTGSYRSISATQSADQGPARQAGAPPSTGLQRRSPAVAPDPLEDLRAKEDDPALWGESPVDLAEQLKRDKPPHWG